MFEAEYGIPKLDLPFSVLRYMYVHQYTEYNNAYANSIRVHGLWESWDSPGTDQRNLNQGLFSA